MTGPTPISFIDVAARKDTDDTLPEQCGLPPVRHRFDADSLHAINAALAAERPLLVRGEPGTGKSQLARTAAFLLDRAFRWKVVDAQTQVSDLFYSFDAVERLAQAQVAGTNRGETRSVAELLDELNFVRPGPLWWAFDAEGAAKQDARYQARSGATTATELPRDADRRGFVVLIDEIDKTDSSVPNGLLEALGQSTFAVPRGQVALPRKGPAPLVVITTNEERELPSAFIRRCMVFQIPVPTGRTELIEQLVARGRTHFRRALDESLLVEAAEMVFDDRKAARERGLPPPGQAEYLDLLRAVQRLGVSTDDRSALLRSIRRFALRKHQELHEPASKPQ
ncbi:AAA family ATPase [Nannocystis punicea]|uniref:MoxR family ATPase n=1 Tax=Nannocystis punicea TaxID=2995304 RepID=A0ABY7HAY5_9BACT|nr:MoxR family ATPase [Nannocystis poenicansa]WAS96398.1 MoxR family ATPase [Nannocystis poenicansa]